MPNRSDCNCISRICDIRINQFGVTLIVPYRDRPEHREQFIATMTAHDIIIVEQLPGKSFNRARLINIGFIETQPDYFCAHDVDMIPEQVDYSPRIGVTQLASSDIQTAGYLGGVTTYDASTFKHLGGYHNDYFHRAEDNEMAFNMQRMGIIPVNRFGTFIVLPHERTGPEFIPALWYKAQLKRRIQNQLSICEYNIVAKTVNENLTHLLVEI